MEEPPLQDSPNGLRLTLFGAAGIGEPGQSPSRSGPWRHSLALLAILAEAGDRGVSRERLTGLLWPDSDTARARNCLKQICFALRRALRNDLLEYVGASLRLNRALVSCDLWDFEAAVAAGDAPGALALYRGPFLEGFSIPGLGELELWIDQQRMRLERSHRTACETLAGAAMEAGKPAEAVDHWRSALAADPLCSRAALGLMQALVASGDRNGALEFSRAYEARVQEELEAPPDPTVSSFVAQLTRPNGSMEVSAPPPPSPPQPPPFAEPTREPSPTALTSLPHLTESDEPPTADRVTRPAALRVALAAATIALGLSLVLLVQAYRAALPSPDIRTTAVAVLPFTVSGTGQPGGGSYLSGALTQLLSANLDSVGALRAIPSDLVQRSARSSTWWRARTSDQARDVATRLGAGFYVTGRVFLSGSRLRVTAGMYSSEAQASSDPVSEGTADGTEAQLFDMVDRLTAQLIAGRYTGQSDRTIRSASLATGSLPAFKAYLVGEELYRQDRYMAALDAFRRAADADSAFALAYYGIARAADAYGQPGPALTAARRASDLRGNLPGRDRDIVEAFHATLTGDLDQAERLYREILADHPEDGEAWWRLGELLLRRDPLLGRSDSAARATLTRATALDSTNLHAVAALGRLTSLDHPPNQQHAALRRRFSVSLARTPAASSRAFGTFVLADHPAVKSITRALLAERAMIPLVLRATVSIYDVDAVEGIGRILVKADQPRELRAYGYRMLAQAALARGEWMRSVAHARMVQDQDQVQGLKLLGTIAALPFVELPRSELARIRQELDRWRPEPEPVERGQAQADDGLDQVLRLHYLGLVNIRLGNLKEALRLAAQLEQVRDSERSRVPVTLARSIRARVAVQRGEPRQALALLERADWPSVAALTVAEAGDRFLRAELLRVMGRDDEALRWYAGLGRRATYEIPYLAPAALRMAGIHDHLGQHEQAARLRDRYVRLRGAADH